MNITINCTEKEAQLISKALDLYSRIGLCQFWYLDTCTSLQNLLWDKANIDSGIQEKFRQKAIELSNLVTGISGNGNFGIFHEKVGNDCKEAAHLHQQIRHEFYKADEDANKPKYVNSAYPADICQIAKIEEPNFKIEISHKEKID